MPTYARGQIVVEDMVGVYHCIARCVRRAFLCGIDPYTGQDYSHRKEWILDRLRDLAGLFAIEVCGYSVMSNHLHLVLRNRPDIAEQWSADEIALRWCRVFPPRDDATGEPVEPVEPDLAMLTANSDRLAEVRKRLANLSWFMRCLSCCWIGRGGNSARTSAARFRITWPRSWSGWGSIDRTGWKPCAASVDYSSRRRADRAHSSMPRHAARGAGSRARRPLEPPLCRPLARHRALNRHLHDAFTRRARPACALTSLPGAVPTGQDEPFYVSRQVTAPIRWSS